MNQRIALAILFITGFVLSGCTTTPKPVATSPTQASASQPAPTTSAAAQAQTPASPIGRDPRAQSGSPLADRVFYFEFDSAGVRSDYLAALTAHAKFLLSSKLRMRIEGHADQRGSAEYNMALGQKRGDAIRRAMTVLGATNSAIETISFGESKPAVVGTDETAWSKNRRVEIRYSDEK